MYFRRQRRKDWLFFPIQVITWITWSWTFTQFHWSIILDVSSTWLQFRKDGWNPNIFLSIFQESEKDIFSQNQSITWSWALTQFHGSIISAVFLTRLRFRSRWSDEMHKSNILFSVHFGHQWMTEWVQSASESTYNLTININTIFAPPSYRMYS